MSCPPPDPKNKSAGSDFNMFDDWKTAPFDSRFQGQNKTRYCYYSFIDFKKCSKKHSEDYEPCKYYKMCYESLCPNEWIEKWNEQIEKCVFPGKL